MFLYYLIVWAPKPFPSGGVTQAELLWAGEEAYILPRPCPFCP